ncbi:YraN family protein [Cocleimonas sp. KMM 6892]|uniref:YraN family protein n=1 Tax=unclassified Cocleimonas TaxID=2639732 RepID=UPI002DBC0F23|nr:MULTISPECIES: YraN family protein [unclassified Cocleimonas]MEB8430630.1 YraN family protein [Cocleimonas sp. KMM 6892]MEC4716919.1 YraN family protein [Cocleimonas sp. KMM 6895]MEC4743931.1 YraN family protein [Cocleimonas sp. KMM 6896]
MPKQLSLFAKQLDKLKSLKSGATNPAKKQLTAKRKKGNLAEEIACDYLLKKGLILKQQNFNTPAGEVDLIMLDTRTSNNSNSDETLVFIEVRYRKNADFGGAAASVTPKKQQRIIKAALAYQQQNAPQSSLRFDVVAIEGDNINDNPKIDWIENAFSGF